MWGISYAVSAWVVLKGIFISNLSRDNDHLDKSFCLSCSRSPFEFQCSMICLEISYDQLFPDRATLKRKHFEPEDRSSASGNSVFECTKCPSVEFYRQLIAVHGEGVMNGSNVRKWCRMFNEGRTNVLDEERSGRPSLITEDLKNRIDQHIRTNRRFTLDGIHEKFPQISRSVNFIRTDILCIQKPNYCSHLTLGGILDWLTQF
jgi:hypothetical protein